MNADAAFAFVIDNLLKSGLLLLAGTAILAVLTRASAANRHVVLLLGFATLLLLPVSGLFNPRWAFPVNIGEQVPPVVVTVVEPILAPIARMETDVSTVSTTPSTQSALQTSKPSVIPWKSLFVSVWLGGAVLLMARRAIITLRMCVLRAAECQSATRGSHPLRVFSWSRVASMCRCDNPQPARCL